MNSSSNEMSNVKSFSSQKLSAGNTEFEKTLSEKVQEVEGILNQYLPQAKGDAKTVMDAMNYSVLAGGKRLRPILMKETYHILGGKDAIIEPFMAALEMIHTYSLVHDDLPAMDNDEYRRGRKTTHIVYGEGVGILAGDGLLNYAFETMLSAFSKYADTKNDIAIYKNVAKAMSFIAKKAGIYGMIGGQTADIEAEEKEKLTKEELLFIHENKTAALIEAAMVSGALLAGATEETVRQMERCAYSIGIAFQIQDDILDVIGDSKELGKTARSDEKNNKQTYVTICGMEQAQREVAKLSQEAVDILSSFEGEHEFLEQLVLSLVYRNK